MVNPRSAFSRSSPRPRPSLGNTERSTSAVLAQAPAESTALPSREAVAAPAPSREPKLFLSRHPLGQGALSTLRDMKTSRTQFRSACARLLSILVIEATKDLPMRETAIQGSAGEIKGFRPTRNLVFLSIAPGGLGVVREIGALIPDVPIGNLNIHEPNEAGERDVRLHLPNAPAFRGTTVLLFVPVLNQNSSVGHAIHFLRQHGVSSLALISLVSAPTIADRLQQTFPELRFFFGAVDDAADGQGHPVPGLGDFAARYYS